MELSERLDAFLAANAATPWQWGVVDCCMVTAAWAMALGFSDPAAALRGSYDDEQSCRDLVAKRGGVLTLLAAFEAIGWRRSAAPEEGAIGVIGHTGDRQRQWGAIRHRGRWLVRMNVGFIAFSARPLAIWVPPCRNS